MDGRENRNRDVCLRWLGCICSLAGRQLTVDRPLEMGYHFCAGVDMKRILVVDDEETVRLLFKEELEEEGYQVELAPSGEDALEKLGDMRPDLITLDLKMPGMGGLEVLSRIREQDKKLPVVICTAYGDYRRDLRTWGSDAYVVKSSDLSRLKETIRAFLEQR